MSEGRYELKYMLPEEKVTRLLHLVRDIVRPDTNANKLPQDRWGYIVSSLYLDTPDLEGYAERLRNEKIRNRVRVRTYGHAGEKQPVFLEAKRKLRREVIKHRVYVTDADTWATLGDRPWQKVGEGLSPRKAAILRRFVDHVDGMGMIPVCIVRYEREIYVNETERLSLDRNIQAVSRPGFDLYAPADKQLVPEGWVVMELKFNGSQPLWMRRVSRELRLRAEPVSKFALGVAHSLRAHKPLEIRQITPYSLLRAGVAA